MEKQIPKKILELSKVLIENYGLDNLNFLTTTDGKELYSYNFPEDVDTGFPFILLYDVERDEAEEITGFEALNFLNKLNINN